MGEMIVGAFQSFNIASKDKGLCSHEGRGERDVQQIPTSMQTGSGPGRMDISPNSGEGGWRLEEEKFGSCRGDGVQALDLLVSLHFVMVNPAE